MRFLILPKPLVIILAQLPKENAKLMNGKKKERTGSLHKSHFNV
jgi:hypothetical protein